MMIKLKKEWFRHYHDAKPFDHIVIDNFLEKSFAIELENSFFDYYSDIWHCYSNAIEEKKTCNIWNEFNEPLYKYFTMINSPSFVQQLSDNVGADLIADNGLHGGGLHIHSGGGNLNPHLDYSIHPKIKMQRKINIIYYCSQDSKLSLGGYGDLGLWHGDEYSPKQLVRSIEPKFNRAVIFDTTQNSWHGLVNAIPKGSSVLRKSLAAYYLTEPASICDSRSRAMFSPREAQKGNSAIEETIRKRGSESTFSEVYVTKGKK